MLIFLVRPFVPEEISFVVARMVSLISVIGFVIFRVMATTMMMEMTSAAKAIMSIILTILCIMKKADFSLCTVMTPQFADSPFSFTEVHATNDSTSFMFTSAVPLSPESSFSIASVSLESASKGSCFVTMLLPSRTTFPFSSFSSNENWSAFSVCPVSTFLTLSGTDPESSSSSTAVGSV